MTEDARRKELQVVQRLRGGDEQAFLLLVERYHPLLVRLARTYLGSAAAAEDLAHETWVNVLRRIDRFDGRSTLRMWLCRLLLELARARGRELEEPAPPGVEEPRQPGYEPAVEWWRLRSDGHWRVPPGSFGDGPERRSLGDDVVTRARAGLEALPLAEREVVTLRDAEGWTAREVCGLLAIGEVQQRALLHRGRSKVRAALEEGVVQAAGVPV